MKRLEQPVCRVIGKRKYELEQCYFYERRVGGKIHCFHVPGGTIWNGASIPRGFWSLLRPGGRILGPSLMHDFIYGEEGCLGIFHTWKTVDGDIKNYEGGTDREQADNIFYRMMREAGIDWFRAKLAYWAVRAFGASHWGK